MARTIAQSPFYQVAPIDPALSYGVVVTGLDPAALQDAQLRSDLYALWIQEGVILFEGLEGSQTHLDLSSIFGKCIMHPVKEGNDGSEPGLIKVEYKPEKGWVTKVDGEARGAWIPWHSDLVYVDRINHGGILRPGILPSKWGQTGFIDKIAAYASLPDDLKQRIEGLHVTYKYDMDVSHQKFGQKHEVECLSFSPIIEAVIARKHEFPQIVHPLVYEQTETGRKVLNLSPLFADRITEMPGEEGDALLAEVVEYVIDEKLAYHHEWKMGQMVLWDNWRVLHKAHGAPADENRLMYRTTIDGDYGLGRVADDQVINRTEYIQV